MNPCAASALQSAEIVHCLKLLREAYCAARIDAAHQAIVKADLNQAIHAGLHANTEFCQGIQQETPQPSTTQEEQ